MSSNVSVAVTLYAAVLPVTSRLILADADVPLATAQAAAQAVMVIFGSLEVEPIVELEGE